MRDDLQHMRDKATELELKMDRVGGARPFRGESTWRLTGVGLSTSKT
jgi:hypothetical protein